MFVAGFMLCLGIAAAIAVVYVICIVGYLLLLFTKGCIEEAGENLASIFGMIFKAIAWLFNLIPAWDKTARGEKVDRRLYY